MFHPAHPILCRCKVRIKLVFITILIYWPESGHEGLE